MINDISIITHSDSHIAMHIELASWFGLSVSTQKTTVKNYGEI